MADGIPVQLLRGGTSKGAYFLAGDLPADTAERDRLLLSVMGSPDPRQIDGIGGGHPLTSKVAVVERSADPGADVDYLFLQVRVDEPGVSAGQPCGNILAGVGPFAIERGLTPAAGETTAVRVRMVNTGAYATVHVPTPGGRPEYSGDTVLSGVPGTASRILVEFPDVTARLPTGRVVDDLDGVPATLIDAGLPVMIIAAEALGVTGYESPTRLEYDERLRSRVGLLQLAAADLTGAGGVVACLVAPPVAGGSLCTRMFVAHGVHSQIGVLAAVTVASAVALPGSVAARPAAGAVRSGVVRLEHPTGFLDVVTDGDRSLVVSTARLLLDGRVFPR
ncbi:PrpF domain-containing protein [Actinoplanes sp. NPDC051861]|uniref:PrpF domain-containing protein n=1 Tax=Actinoplanes sp. NPDC051861 TaxID=3155170 RepID=UPI00342DF72D